LALISTFNYRLTVEDGQLPKVAERDQPRWASTTRKRETVTLTGSAFTALSPPSAAVAVAIFFPTTAKNLTLKGVTGDTGVKIVPLTNPIGLPLVMPLGASPSIGILNNDSTAVDVEVQWL
jgi:hypothetical protein